MRELYGPFIDGEWLAEGDRSLAEVYNPATGEVVGRVALATAEDVDRALQAADRAFREWRKVAPDERARLLHRAADVLEARLEDTARLLTMEQGKPLVDARKELQVTVRLLRLYAEEATRVEGMVQRGASGKTLSLAMREPIGPSVLIGPWNYPVELIAFKLAPAIAAGCSVVVKPPTQTPLAVLELVGCFEAAGAPAGLVNAVVGAGSTVGEAAIRHPLTRKVAFTGSTEVGRQVARVAGEALKPVTLELGGNAPFIVFADADLDLAVSGAIRRSFSNAGQICIAVNRIYVERPLFERFVEAFVERVRALVVADGLKVPDADMGPLISREAVSRMTEYVAEAVAQGARVLAGGVPLTNGDYGKGHFFAPTVLVGVTEAMRCVREETFGPIAPILPFDHPYEALSRANATEYGLAAYVYTRDLERAMAAAQEIEAGGIGVNVNDVTELTMPFGGWKHSGIGRELGRYGLENYLQWKHVRVKLP